MASDGFLGSKSQPPATRGGVTSLSVARQLAGSGRSSNNQEMPPATSSAANVEGVAAELVAKWPARAQQIKQLLRLIGRPGQAGMDMFVYGAPKSGKTTMVRACLSHLGRHHAYCELGDTTKPKQLYSSVLSQLHATKRKREAGYAGSSADNVADFVNELARACLPNSPTTYIVLDGAQLVARSQMLPAMMAAREITGANVAYILISSVPWSSQWFFEGVNRGVMPQVYFPAYLEPELTRILSQELQTHMHQGSAAALLSPVSLLQRLALVPHFVSGVVCAQFTPVTRSLSDLRAVAAFLWDAYIQPTNTGKPEFSPTQPIESVARRLVALVKERLVLTLEAFQPGMSHACLIDVAVRRVRGVSMSSGLQGGDQSHLTQYEQEWGSLPVTAKLLVVAAFIASSNKASQDKAVFEASGAGSRAGRVRGARAAQDSDRQAEAIKEAKLKGPSPFSLNRLLTIYHCLHMAADHCGAQAAATQRVQGLHALKPSFVITSVTLSAMDKCDRMSDDRDKHDAAAPPTSQASSQAQRGGAAWPLLLQGVVTGTVVEEEDDEEEVEGEDFQRALAQAQRRGGRTGRGGATARTKAKKGAPASHVATTAGAVDTSGSLYPPVAPGGLRLDGAAAHVPHPASGVARQGAVAMASDPAPLLNNITTLTNMGLLKRAAAEDMLEAPRLVVGCVDEQLAAALARDCGLKLASYLKYA